MSPNGVLWTAVIDRLRLADGLAADGARVLERDRVALLRHDAAALHEAVAEPQVAELHRAPEQQVLNDAAEADEQDRGAPTRSRAGSRPSRCCRRCCRSGRRSRAARSCAARSIGKAGAGDRAGAERVPVGARRRPPAAAPCRARAARSPPAGSARWSRAAPAACACARRRPSRGAARRDRSSAAAAPACRRAPRAMNSPLPHPVHRHVDVVPAARGVQAAGDVLAAAAGDQPLEIEEQILVGAVVGDRRAPASSEMPSSAARMRPRIVAARRCRCSASITRWA